MATIEELRDFARTLDDTSEGWSSKGTINESRTVKVDGRPFLFLGTKGVVRLKLAGSVPQAKKLAKKQPDIYEIGSGNWIKIILNASARVDDEMMQTWIMESYDLILNFRTRRKTPKAKPKKRA